MNPLFGMIADVHLSENNISEVEPAVYKAIDECIKIKCKDVFLIGDIFSNRKALSFHTIQAFLRILDYCSDHDIEVHLFPGNHDKISYISEDSYLDVYQHHPAVTLYRVPGGIEIGGWNIHILPFFHETKKLPEYLDKVQSHIIPGEKNLLLTHIAIDGVRNNDGSEVDGVLHRDLFKMFFKVFVGHYHDKQSFNNINYIGSLRQNNYGEDDLKGITFFYENGDHSQVILKDQSEFMTVDIDLDTYSKKEVEETLVDIYKSTDSNVRFKFHGTKDQLKTIDKTKISSLGIDVAYKEVVDEDIKVEEQEVIDFSAFTKVKILGEWDTFCDKSEVYKSRHEEGKQLLQAI